MSTVEERVAMWLSSMKRQRAMQQQPELYRLTIFFTRAAWVMCRDGVTKNFPIPIGEPHVFDIEETTRAISILLRRSLTQEQIQYIELGRHAGLVEVYSCLAWAG